MPSEYNRWGVVRIAGTEPEQFMIIFVNDNARQGQSFMKTLEPMTEPELRDELTEMGLQAGRATELIEHARKDPH